MLTAGIVLIAVGSGLSLASFLYALYRMGKWGNGFFKGFEGRTREGGRLRNDQQFSGNNMVGGFFSMFTAYLGVMAGMAVGGFMVVVGVVVVIVHFVQAGVA